MFIPFEPNPAGMPATPSKKKRRHSRKHSKTKSRLFSANKKKKEDQVFIPGSGTERMLFKSTPAPLNALPPLGFHKVKATQSLKEKIAEDKRAKKELKRKAKEVARTLRSAMGLRKDKTSQYINSLVLGYLDLLPQKQMDETAEVAISRKNHVVIQCGPPVANPAAALKADPWSKRRL